MSVLRRLRQAIRAQNYRISGHANDEMADDYLMAADVEQIVFAGAITNTFTHESARYSLRGARKGARWALGLYCLSLFIIRRVTDHHRICRERRGE